jgi:hypothetical protein
MLELQWDAYLIEEDRDEDTPASPLTSFILNPVRVHGVL